MPLYGDEKRKYDREWVANRRKEYFKDKKCAKCGSTKDLQLDHINPETKITNRIWSWSKNRREEELKKCQVLCKKCHKEKTVLELKKWFTGVPHTEQRKLNEQQVKEIRANANRHTDLELSKIYNVAKITIWKIKKRLRYQNII